MQKYIKELQNDCSKFFSSDEFNREFYYDGNDLGFTYSKDATTFKLWSPVASKVSVNLYKSGYKDDLMMQIPMIKGDKGVFEVTVDGDLEGVYYTYFVMIEDIRIMDRSNGENVAYEYHEGEGYVTNETFDPYAKAAGVNGRRSMVVNLSNTNPDGWDEDKSPEFDQMTDAVIYEMHVRDISIDESSGIKAKGKFLGLIENGTVNKSGSSTGIDHMKELGVTHVHLLPSYDYQTIDEADPDNKNFNWGYDPQNYNLPEGSYSTNPFDGHVRIKEFKEMVAGFHKNGIRVIMDVVYNHTFSAYDSCFNMTMPNYYYRNDGHVNSNGSGCGNETASDRLMFRKYMIDSCKYWVKEYHVDGLRFDLMAVHDIETMDELSRELKKINPSIIIYGEGWNGGPSLLDKKKACFKDNAKQFPLIAAFSDDIRDAIKGSVMDEEDKGFINGGLKEKSGEALESMVNTIKFGICGATKHPQIKTQEYFNEEKCPKFWASNPTQCITYVSVHDNWTLWDKLNITCPDASEQDKIRMNKLSAAIIFTSQGIPLFQAGEEMLRSKPTKDGYEENSYNSSDEVNSIKWERKDKYKDVVEYYKGLISFRKAHKALRMTTEDEVAGCIQFADTENAGVVAFSIDAKNAGDISDSIYVIINGNDDAYKAELPDGTWSVFANAEKAGTTALATANTTIEVPGLSAVILAK